MSCHLKILHAAVAGRSGLGAAFAAAPLVLALTAGAPTPAPFNDLNRNGRLDPYEDPSLSPERRADDLVSRMTLEEKAGAMMHGTLPGEGGLAGMSDRGYDLAAAETLILSGKINSFITRLSLSPRVLAEQSNAVQRIARRSRLGIPLTISTDPRNHFQVVLGASSAGGGFSLWPETLGFAALRDPALVRRFGDFARREYRAVGIHMALSPQADLATEPRWPRVTATFGSDPALVSELAGAYVQGFQHGTTSLARDGVATVVKHWVGYGAQPDGFDGHNRYGRFAKLDDISFARHVRAFDGAFKAGSAGVMPTYPILQGVIVHGRAIEPLGAGYSRQLLTELLRGERRYRGLILSDWGITNDCPDRCRAPSDSAPQRPQDIGMPWGVEELSPEQRFAKGVQAGLDQFGGVDNAAPLIAAVRNGAIAEGRLDVSVRRIMALKFRLGLFEDPFVDPAAAERVVGDPTARRAAEEAQRAATVLLKDRGVLPVTAGRRVWLYGVDPQAARAGGLVPVAAPENAEFALVRTATPSEKLHPDHFFGARQNEGRLDLRPGDQGYDAVVRAAARVPTIVAIDMDRPAIISAVGQKAAALIVLFGASDAALVDIVTGKARSRGRLPFELPSSMQAVAQQDPARSDDSTAPDYPAGAGVVR